MTKMKDSGVKWIGQIPENWKVCSIKQLCQDVFSGGTPDTTKSEYWDGEIPWLPSGSVQNNIIESAPKTITQLGLEKSSTRYIPSESILLAMTGATCSNVGYLTFDSCANQSVMAYIPKEDVNSKYIYYTLIACREEILLHKNGGAQSGINGEDCKNFKVPFVNKCTQDRIVSKLDKKCGEIDELIAIQEKEIEKLKEYKTSVITKAVTKGLDDSVPMKDSGIDWIGQIPAHWKVCKIKNIVKICNGREVESSEGDIPVYGSGGAFGFTNKHLYDKESVLLGRKGTIDKPIYIPDGDKIWCVDTMFYTIDKGIMNMKLFYYIMSVFDYKRYIYGTALPSMSQGILNEIYIPLPEYKEQLHLLRIIEAECDKMELLINKKQQKIEKLQEYKKSLIYEYVTGKKEV